MTYSSLNVNGSFISCLFARFKLSALTLKPCLLPSTIGSTYLEYEKFAWCCPLSGDVNGLNMTWNMLIVEWMLHVGSISVSLSNNSWHVIRMDTCSMHRLFSLLRSTASGTLLVPRARTATSQRSFAINGPRTWNSLPADLRTPDTTLCSFKRHLNAHLFQQ